MTQTKEPLPILRTKFYAPSVTLDHLRRARLLSKMDRTLQVPLTLVSAPAGYGKSVLASDWIRAHENTATWFSLDETDSDLRQFLSCLACAIENIAPQACRDIRARLSAPELAPIKSLASYFVNSLLELDHACVIVLDDYHRLKTGSAVSEFLSIVLNYPPPSLHLVILTRRDPQLQLSKLRVSGQLEEIRIVDLRFSFEETSELIKRVHNRNVTRAALEHLNDEIEGWVAGLRLVALAMKNTQDPNALLNSLHGGLQQAQEYMLNEVVDGLSPKLRKILVQSSILNYFNASLINEVCFADHDRNSENHEGQQFVEKLANDNIFAISLDANGEWYRYHHWFHFILRRQLECSLSVDDIRDLHLRAGRWFEDNNEISEALLHFLSAGNVTAAAKLISGRARHYIEKDQWFMIDQWLDLFPEELQADRPDMQLVRAWVGFCQLNTVAVQACVDRLETLLGESTIPEKMVNDINFLKGWLAFWNTDLDLAITYFMTAIDGFDLSPGMIAGELRFYFALATAMSGDYPAAVKFLKAEYEKAGQSSGLSYNIRVTGCQAHLHLLFGNIRASIQAMDAMSVINSHSGNAYAKGWDLYMHGLQYWQLYEREKSLKFYQSTEACRKLVERRAAIDMLAGQALVHQSLQQTDDAKASLDNLAILVRDFGASEHDAAVESCRARVDLMRGNNTQAALDWARTVFVPKLSPIEIYLWADEPIVTRSRVLVVAGNDRDIHEGLAILDDLYAQAQRYCIVCQLIDIQLLRVLAHFKLGDTHQAMSILTEVLPTAAQGGWVRPFVEIGPPLNGLLYGLNLSAIEDDFVQCVLRHIDSLPDSFSRHKPITSDINHQQAEIDTVMGPDELTNRELDILACLEQRLQNKEIASKLYISPHTVSYHLKHIYQKLGVNSRRQAVLKAYTINVLPLH